MRDLVVCDASAIIAMLIDSGPDGRWATDVLIAADLYAPTLMPFECANITGRHERAGAITAELAAQASADLLDLPIEYWPYDVVAQLIWELRNNLTSCDAAYVALAESLGATLITLDRRIRRAPGLRCEVASL